VNLILKGQTNGLNISIVKKNLAASFIGEWVGPALLGGGGSDTLYNSSSWVSRVGIDRGSSLPARVLRAEGYGVGAPILTR